jgi:DNA-binding IclR family transcriptional regulator
MAGGAAESGRSVTSKVTAILMVFSRGDAYSLTELAQLTGLPISTAHRLAGELAARRLLERTADGGYRIGLPLRMIGAGATIPGPVAAPPAAEESLLARASAVMVDLAAATHAPVSIGLLRGMEVVTATVRPGDRAPTGLGPGRHLAQDTALGRVLLAFSPPAVVDEALRNGSPMTELRRSLPATRLTRSAVTRDGPSAQAVAMPVFGAGGTLLAALELDVGGMAEGLSGARAALAVATGSLSRQLATAPPAEATAV